MARERKATRGAIALLFIVMFALTCWGQEKQSSDSLPLNIGSGRRLVHASCETCHSISPGKVSIGPNLFGEIEGEHPRNNAAQVSMIVKNGKNKMPAFGDVLTKTDIDCIVAYLKTLR